MIACHFEVVNECEAFSQSFVFFFLSLFFSPWLDVLLVPTLLGCRPLQALYIAVAFVLSLHTHTVCVCVSVFCVGI